MKKKTRRGDPDVVSKRKIARAFNKALGNLAKKDGRQERKNARLLDDLKNRHNLSAIAVLRAVSLLVERGVSLHTIRAARPPTTRRFGDQNDHKSLVKTLRSVHETYHFTPESYRFVGVTKKTLVEALGDVAKTRTSYPASLAKRRAAENEAQDEFRQRVRASSLSAKAEKPAAKKAAVKVKKAAKRTPKKAAKRTPKKKASKKKA